MLLLLQDKEKANLVIRRSDQKGVTPPEDKVCHSFVSLPALNPETLRTAKAFADKAVKVS